MKRYGQMTSGIEAQTRPSTLALLSTAGLLGLLRGDGALRLTGP